MQTIGLIGGMSWESSAVYYQALNQGVASRRGGLTSARVVLSSVDFAELTLLQEADRWDEIAQILTQTAQGVERAGADFLLLGTTTFHEVADQVANAVDIPFLHLADVLAEACLAAESNTVGFLGTAFAMSRPFFTERLSTDGLNVLVPDDIHHVTLNSVIYDELVHGEISAASRRRVVHMIEELADAGADGIILGCTELEQLIRPGDCDIPLFPGTRIHVDAAIERALAAH